MFQLLFDQFEYDCGENTDCLANGLWAALSSWSTSDKEGIQCCYSVVKPLQWQIFDWNHCVAIKEKYENQFKTANFTGKMKITWEQ